MATTYTGQLSAENYIDPLLVQQRQYNIYKENQAKAAEQQRRLNITNQFRNSFYAPGILYGATNIVQKAIDQKNATDAAVAQARSIIDGSFFKQPVEPNTTTDTSTSSTSQRSSTSTPMFTGDLGSFQARKNWVQEHKDYLKEKGAGIDWNNYRGTAEQNLALKRLLGGYDAWNSARVAAAQPRVTNEEKFVKEGYTSGRQWQDAELQNMEGSSALYLNPEDYTRWMALQTGKKPAGYVVPTPPRKDIYNPSTAVAPRAQVNPIVAAPNYGTEVGSGPTNPNPRADFIENTYTQMKPSGVQAGSASTQARPKTVQEARLQKAQSLTQSSDPIDNALGRMYLAGNKAKHKIGGKINYQKIFK